MLDMNRRHEAELKTMQHKIHAASDMHIAKFKLAAQEALSKRSTAHGLTDKQVKLSSLLLKSSCYKRDLEA